VTFTSALSHQLWQTRGKDLLMSHSLWQQNPKVNLQFTLSIKSNTSELHNISGFSDCYNTWHNAAIREPSVLHCTSSSATRTIDKTVLRDAQTQPLDSILDQSNPHTHTIQFNINFPLNLGLPSGFFSSGHLMLSCVIQHQSSRIWVTCFHAPLLWQDTIVRFKDALTVTKPF
jgi:hypothetical protein